jgi:protocatechuate 3,4-dioxygenase beta subunit
MLKLLYEFWFFPFLFSAVLSGGEDWKAVLASENVKGERMVVTGTVYDSDGKTPAEGVNVYVYQTDSKGIYGKGENLIDGTMITNSKGQYEYHTIKPGTYPEGGFAAHVHYKITGNSYPEQWFELRFKGDKYLKDSDYKKEDGKGNFSQIQKLEKGKDGILKCRMDIRLVM